MSKSLRGLEPPRESCESLGVTVSGEKGFDWCTLVGYLRMRRDLEGVHGGEGV